MIKITLQNLKPLILNWLMAFLFLGGLALAGSEFTGFPWGQIIGVSMLVVFAFIGNLKRGKN